MSKPNILVFGSTGSVGIEVAKVLAKKGVPFRAVIHTESKADQIKSLGPNIETVKVDVWNKDSVIAAATGIEKVFLMTPPGQTASGFIMAEALKAAGVKYIVKLSALGAQDQDFHWGYEHKNIEDLITKLGIPLTSIRPSYFMTNSLNDVDQIKKGTIYKANADVKLNYISTQNIGEIIALCLTEPGHEGKVYNLTGPDNLSFHEFTQLLSSVIGKEVKYVPIDDATLRKAAAGFLPNEKAINGFSNLFEYFRKGAYDVQFPDTENLLKRKPDNVRSFLEANKQRFL